MKLAEASKRPYLSPLREEQARRTRWAILRAAEKLFAERGYVSTSINDIAREAGVSRATVSSAVGTKPDLLKQAYDTAIAGDDAPVSMTERRPAQLVAEAVDPEAVIEAYVAHADAICARVAGLAEAIRGAAGADADAHALWRDSQAQRLRAATIVVDQIRRVGELREGLAPDIAADLIWLFNDATLYRSLVHERGWSRQQYRSWLSDSLKGQLLVSKQRS